MAVVFGNRRHTGLVILAPRKNDEPTGPFRELAEKVRQIVGNLTTRQVANKTNGVVSASTVSRALNGERIDDGKLDELAKAFKVDPNELRPLANYPKIADSPASSDANYLDPKQAELLSYMSDPQILKIVRYAAGMPNSTKGVALETVRALAIAAGIEIVDDKYQNAAELAEDKAKRTTHGARTED